MRIGEDKEDIKMIETLVEVSGYFFIFLVCSVHDLLNRLEWSCSW